MRVRVLQHEKRTDNIRIGRAYEIDDTSAKTSVQAVIDTLSTSREITPEEFGKYCGRIAIVNAETLAVIKIVYDNENVQ